MTKITDQDKFYKQVFRTKYDSLIKELDKLFRKKDSVYKHVKLNHYRNELIETFWNFTKKDVGKGFEEDPFVARLTNEFKFIKDTYEDNPVKKFLKRDLSKLRNDFKSRQDKILFPEIYKGNDDVVLTFLGKYCAVTKFLDDSRDYWPKKEDSNEFVINQIKLGRDGRSELVSSSNNEILGIGEDISKNILWNQKENVNQFVQIVYALHEAKFIKGEITKIIPELANFLKIPLGPNWKSNHSKSIHSNNSEYEPAVFKKLIQAYSDYSVRKRNEEKKNKAELK